MAKSNPLSKSIVIAVSIAVVLLVALSIKKSKTVSADDVLAAESADSAMPESENGDVTYVVEGEDADTYTDTVNTLIQQVKSLKQQQSNGEPVVDEEMREEIEQLKAEKNASDGRVEQLVSEFKELSASFERYKKNKVTKTEQSLSDNTDDGFSGYNEYPLNGSSRTVRKNEGLPQMSAPNSSNIEQVNYSDEIVWITPIDAQISIAEDGRTSYDIPNISLDGSFAKNTYNAIADSDYGQTVGLESEVQGIPYITVPRGATFINSITHTALIGRIPIGGEVVDPYRFKALVSSENLASNGIEIDGLSGAVVGGRARGDHTLRCVSGYIDYITFTFNDGTIATYPEGEGSESSQPLGYLSDITGTPCISGEYITNAPEYLGQKLAMTGITAAANGYAQSNVTTSTSAEGSTSTVTDADDYAIGEAISGGSQDVVDWLDERQQGAFDAVYVKPATHVTINIEEQLLINYNPKGRKTNHEIYENANNNSYDYSGLN